MKEDKNNLISLFQSEVNRFLEAYPSLKYQWKDDNYVIGIEGDKEGFGLEIHLDEKEITLYTDYGIHQHLIPDENEPISEFVASTVGLIRDLLSPDMRIKEYQSNGKGYRWDLEGNYGGKWEREDTTSLIFFNYFGTRSFTYFTNNLLPGRLCDRKTEQ